MTKVLLLIVTAAMSFSMGCRRKDVGNEGGSASQVSHGPLNPNKACVAAFKKRCDKKPVPKTVCTWGDFGKCFPK